MMMKRTKSAFLFGGLCLALALQTPLTAQQEKLPGGDLSLKLEIQGRIDKGIAFLMDQQKEDGTWGAPHYEALTALPLSAFMGNPDRDLDAELPEGVKKGYQFLLDCQQRDGGIYTKGLGTYNTSLSLMSFLYRGNEPEFEMAIRAARKFLINQQADFDTRGVTDNEYDGGIGYGGTWAHSDLSNSHLAMEALHYSKAYLADSPDGVGMELDWDAAIEFVSRCQNLEATNDLTDDYLAIQEEDKGGFVYFPGDSKAGEVEISDDKVALRSYGSMSYAGLLSFIYADMDMTDPRVIAVQDWLGRNYTLEENPGMGAQGLFYYFHTMAKALAISGVGEKLELADGTKIDWREKLAVKLIDTQRPDGSWINEGSSRWMEDDPVLVTCYAILALEHISRQL